MYFLKQNEDKFFHDFELFLQFSFSQSPAVSVPSHMGGLKDWGTTNCKRNSITFSFKNTKKIMIIYQIFDYLLAHMGRPKDGGALNCKRNSINVSFKN